MKNAFFSLAGCFLFLANSPVSAGEPFPAVPNRGAVGAFTSPSVEFRANNSHPQLIESMRVWVGNPNLYRDPLVQPGTQARSEQLTSSRQKEFPHSCWPRANHCDFSTYHPHNESRE